MLIARQCDTERHTWSPLKLGTFESGTRSTRMPDFEPSSRLPNWRAHYHYYTPSTEDHPASSQPGRSVEAQGTGNAGTHHTITSDPSLGHRHSFAYLSQGQDTSNPAPIDRPDSAPGHSRDSTLVESRKTVQTPLNITSFLGEAGLTAKTNTSPALHIKSEAPVGVNHHAETMILKEEQMDDDEDGDGGGDDDDDDDDDDVLGPEGHGNLTEAEAQRRAERRKMKRFRRAKIKRLTADDRERMMRMRAVPDDFDNVQALHSPYGAMQGSSTPMVSPVDFRASFGDQSMMHPLVNETIRRQEHDEHLSPSSLTPRFSDIGFSPSGSMGMGTSDVLSSLSTAPNDRYYPSQLTSPLSGGPRTANQVLLQNNSDNYQMQPQLGHRLHSTQSLQLRESGSRSRSDSLQSPLRSIMSWKGDSLDYGNYQPTPASPSLTGRQRSLYQPEPAEIGQNNQPRYESIVYPNPNLHASLAQSVYQNSPQSTPSSLSAGSRFHAASSAFSPGLETRAGYRALSSQSTPHGFPTIARQRSFADTFGSGFSSAPLLPPTDYQISHAPADASSREYSTAPPSASLASPQDLHPPYANSSDPNRPLQQQRVNERPFSAQATQSTAAVGLQGQQQIPTERLGSTADEYQSAASGQKRKRTFSMPGAYMPS
ncbi:MAG: hypothetical protein M1818_000439 [Claussenomyces sp. TS43310]|nr:MAG: hypothetical protein M1818_000439 [Claussenomyces sp. TS43310]